MKIGMMVDTYKPHMSGVTNVVALSKKYLEHSGHDVYVFTFGDEKYQDDEPNVIRSPGVPLSDSSYYVGLRYTRKAHDLLMTMDILHTHHPFLSGTLALLYRRSQHIPIIFTNHTRYDLYAHAYLPILPEAVGDTAIKAYLPPFCRAIDMVSTPSPGMAQVLVKLGVDVPVKIIPNGIQLDPFQKKEASLSRSDFGIKPADILLIYTGRLGPEKNTTFLLRSFAGVADAMHNVHLIMVGDGPERDNLQDLAKHLGVGEKVHFTGLVPYQQMPAYLTMSDAFVTASVTEVHPLTVIEAMATGLPVLGIKSVGVGDIVEDGITGYLASEDIASYTAKMMLLVTEHSLRKELGENAQRASHDYDINLTTQTWLTHYKGLVDKTRVGRKGLRNKFIKFFNRRNK